MIKPLEVHPTYTQDGTGKWAESGQSYPGFEELMEKVNELVVWANRHEERWENKLVESLR